jgi:putative membrane protein
MVKSLLSEADAREVEAAVARVESHSAAEVVVAVLPRSGEYWQVRVALAVAWGLAAGLAFLHFEPWRHPALAVGCEVLVGALAFWLGGWGPLERRLAGARQVDAAVRARAFQLFAERGLQGTRGRTALLVFVTELERRVVLLGDRTLNERLGQRGWDEQVELLLFHIRKGHAREGLLAVLERLEPLLAELAPREQDDANELPDAVVRG